MRCKRHRFDPWRRKWKPTPVFLPGKFHRQRRLVGYSPWGCRVRHACTQSWLWVLRQGKAWNGAEKNEVGIEDKNCKEHGGHSSDCKPYIYSMFSEDYLLRRNRSERVLPFWFRSPTNDTRCRRGCICFLKAPQGGC